MHVSIYAVAAAAIVGSLLGSLVLAPLIGRRLRRNQEPALHPLATVPGEPADALVYAHGTKVVASSPGYHSVPGPISIELRNGRRVMRTTLSSTSAARLAAALLAILPAEDDEPDDFLTHIHQPNEPGPGGEQRR